MSMSIHYFKSVREEGRLAYMTSLLLQLNNNLSVRDTEYCSC